MLKYTQLIVSGTGTERQSDHDADTATDLEKPWRVLIHNDSETPYDFVILILANIFKITPMIAEFITHSAHTKGIAYVASYPQSEAVRRVNKAHFAARLEGFPLTFTAEPE